MSKFINALLYVLLVSTFAMAQIKMPQKGLCAHRGASFSHPENSLSAFREAIRLGAHMIEFDVQMSKDSTLVIIHDKNVARTTDGSGLVADLTLNELKALDTGSWKNTMFAGEKIPTLTETLAIMPRNIWLNIHIRGGTEIGLAVAKMIIKEGRIHQSLMACDTLVAAAVKSFDNSIKICNMERMKSLAEYADLTIRRKAEFIQLRESDQIVLADYAQRLRQNDIKINYYYAESADQLKELFSIGVDFALVNDLAALIKSAGEMGIVPIEPVF
jgi:glycerophosphoryl diester phosphodiesterase